MTLNDEYSTFEGYTMELANTAPLPNDMSTDDESIDVQQIQTPQKRSTAHEPMSSGKLDARILDHLHDTTVTGNESFEVDEAVKGRAEQAEQTAHRFLELVEPDEGDVTVLHADGNRSTGAEEQETAIARQSPSNGLADKSSAVANATTPLLKRMADLHLKDSPANGTQRADLAKRRLQAGHNNWWLTKAKRKLRTHCLKECLLI